jgi:hypothetical protein
MTVGWTNERNGKGIWKECTEGVKEIKGQGNCFNMKKREEDRWRGKMIGWSKKR